MKPRPCVLSVVLIAALWCWSGQAWCNSVSSAPGHSTFEKVVPGGAIYPTVEFMVQRRPRDTLLVLMFRVGNGSTASGSIKAFGIYDVKRPRATQRPPEWVGLYGTLGNDSSMVWACTDTLTARPPGWTKRNFWPSPYMIVPGDSTRTFAAVLTNAPRRLGLFAFAFDPLGSATMPRLMTIPSASWHGEIELPVIPRGRSETTLGPVARFLDGGGSSQTATTRTHSVSYGLPKDGQVELDVIGGDGQVTRHLVKGARTAGLYVTLWDGRRDSGTPCEPGAYAYRLRFEGREVGSRTVTLSR